MSTFDKIDFLGAENQYAQKKWTREYSDIYIYIKKKNNRATKRHHAKKSRNMQDNAKPESWILYSRPKRMI